MKNSPPSAKGHWLLGSLFAFRKDPLSFLVNCHKKLGDLVHFRFGPTHCFLIVHPDDIKYILKDRPENYGINSPAHHYLKKFYGEGLLTSEGSKWEKQRKTAQTNLRLEKIMEMVPSMTAIINRRLDRWQFLADQQKSIDIFPEIVHMTLGIADHMLLGGDFRDEEIDKIKNSMMSLSSYLVDNTRRLIKLPTFIPTKKNLDFKENLSYLKNITKKLVKKHQTGQGIPDGLVSTIITDNTSTDTGKINYKNVYDEVFTFLLTSYPTTALKFLLILVQGKGDGQDHCISE